MKTLVLSLGLAVSFAVSALLFPPLAWASGTYLFNIAPRGLIQASCQSDGQTVRSQIRLSMNKINPTKELQTVALKLNVCALGRLYKSAFSLLLPLKAWTAHEVSREWRVYSHPKNLTEAEYGADAPDRLHWRTSESKNGTSVYEFMLINSSTGDVKVGPIRAMVVDPAKLQGVSGVTANTLPLLGLDVEVPDKMVRLTSQLSDVR
jgi:hypothetical protein